MYSTSLQHLDVSSLVNLKEVGNCFLYGCTSLQDVLLTHKQLSLLKQNNKHLGKMKLKLLDKATLQPFASADCCSL